MSATGHLASHAVVSLLGLLGAVVGAAFGVLESPWLVAVSFWFGSALVTAYLIWRDR